MINEGWQYTKALGVVYLDDKGKVKRATTTDGSLPLFPFRWNGRLNIWTNCSGYYTPSYLAKLMKNGQAKWA